MKDQSFAIENNQDLRGGYFHLSCRTPDECSPITPGQFAMLKPDWREDPLLRRPFSYADVPDQGRVTFLGKIVGKSTQALASLRPGDSLRVLGPLGKGFQLEGEGRAVLIAGGVGIAPFFLLSRQLRAQGKEVVLFFGGRSRKDIVLMEVFEELGVRCYVSTEEGDMGQEGLVTEYLSDELLQRGDNVFCCGPEPMMERVHRYCRERRIATQFSVEPYMGCGIGACLGCVVPLTTQEGYAKACVDGPVFRGGELAW